MACDNCETPETVSEIRIDGTDYRYCKQCTDAGAPFFDDGDDVNNETRADFGGAAFGAYREHWSSRSMNEDELDANRETIVQDMLADVAHFCERYAIDPDAIFASGLESYRQDRIPGEIGAHKPVEPIRERAVN